MKSLITSIRFMLVMTVLTGLIYPLSMTVISQLLFPEKANGKLELIAQKFTQEKYFWSRPSAIDYNPMPSGGTNLGPISQDLLAKVNERKAIGATDDLLFASGSGLDPQISPKNAYNQIPRVAKARGVKEETLRDIVRSHIEGRQFGFLGEERVNVLTLNLALDERQNSP